MWKFSSTFSTYFSETTSKENPLLIERTSDAKPVRVKLWNYFPSQREFMKKIMDELVSYGIMYPIRSSPWASAFHIVPNSGMAMWRRTADRTPVNKLTVPYRFPMLVIEHELTKIADSRVFASVKFTHNYWQILLAESSVSVSQSSSPTESSRLRFCVADTNNAVLHL